MFFKNKSIFCTICKKQLNHKYKPKKNWNINGYLCNNCYLDELKKQYERNNKKNCYICNKLQNISNMWEPRFEWNITEPICEECFTKKESDFQHKKNFCSICNKKLGFIRYNPKGKRQIDGQLCKLCWVESKSRYD